MSPELPGGHTGKAKLCGKGPDKLDSFEETDVAKKGKSGPNFSHPGGPSSKAYPVAKGKNLSAKG